jgi:hypothetical protein
MTYISKCEHGVYMALCSKCFSGQVNVEFNKDDYCSPQLKTLTDAEIRTIQDMCHLKNVGYNTFIMRFARAILRKAQEK